MADTAKMFTLPRAIVVALVLMVAGTWLLLDNPTVDGAPVWDSYSCLAPYDTVLNNADNYPGGEHPEDLSALAHRCQTVGERRFWAGAGLGTVGLVLLVGAPGVARRRRLADSVA